MRLRQRELLTIVLSVLVACFVSACGTAEFRRYQPNPPDAGLQTLPLRIAVVEFEDWNKYENYSNFHAALWTLGYVPLIPYMSEFDHYFPTKFGECLAAELTAAKFFTDVHYYPNWEEIQLSHKEYDLLITGKLKEDKTHSDFSFYGLGPVGLYLSMTNIMPTDFVKRHVEMEVLGFRPAAPTHELFVKHLQFDDSKNVRFISGRSGNDLGEMIGLANHGHAMNTDDPMILS